MGVSDAGSLNSASASLRKPDQAILLIALLAISQPALAESSEALVRARLDADAAAGRPLVAHVVVALADNVNQGIVPVPTAIGDGQKPSTNLYWGAGYGVRYYFGHKAGWTEFRTARPTSTAVLERVVFRRSLQRGARTVTAYVVADAYDGARIRDATIDLLEYAAGRGAQQVTVKDGAQEVMLAAGGSAAVIAYVGHDGLMDFSVPSPAAAASDGPARSTIVLACQSGAFFGPHLKQSHALPLLMTYGLMAPEAYTLDAALQRWFSDDTSNNVRGAAAEAYDRFQHCGLKGARRLFGHVAAH